MNNNNNPTNHNINNDVNNDIDNNKQSADSHVSLPIRMTNAATLALMWYRGNVTDLLDIGVSGGLLANDFIPVHSDGRESTSDHSDVDMPSRNQHSKQSDENDNNIMSSENNHFDVEVVDFNGKNIDIEYNDMMNNNLYQDIDININNKNNSNNNIDIKNYSNYCSITRSDDQYIELMDEGSVISHISSNMAIHTDVRTGYIGNNHNHCQGEGNSSNKSESNVENTKITSPEDIYEQYDYEHIEEGIVEQIEENINNIQLNIQQNIQQNVQNVQQNIQENIKTMAVPLTDTLQRFSDYFATESIELKLLKTNWKLNIYNNMIERYCDLNNTTKNDMNISSQNIYEQKYAECLINIMNSIMHMRINTMKCTLFEYNIAVDKCNDGLNTLSKTIDAQIPLLFLSRPGVLYRNLSFL
jgi:hypothetical protein